MMYMQDWEKTKKRFEAFWNGEVADRCCIAVTAPKKGADMPEPFDFTKAGDEEKLRYWTDGEAIIQRKLREFESTFFGGDAFPQIFLNLGAAGHAGYFKNAKYRFEDTVWFFEWINDVEKDPIEFDPNTFLYRKTLELARYFADESCGRYFISMPDDSGNLDALAHMRGNTNLLMDLYDDREWVKSSLEKMEFALENMNRQIFDIVCEKNDGGSCIGWLNTWSPGKHAQMQCDFSVMISPEDYRELVLPELTAQSAMLDNALYHLDGIEQVRFLDMLLKSDAVDAIQWTWVAGQLSPAENLPTLKRIQAAGKKLVLPCVAISDIPILLSELSSKGLLIYAKADSQDEAEQIILLAEKLTHE